MKFKVYLLFRDAVCMIFCFLQAGAQPKRNLSLRVEFPDFHLHGVNQLVLLA
jgi:hypothetical protein